MMPSITSRNTSGFMWSMNALGDEGARHQRSAGDQALEQDVRRQRAEALEGDRLRQIEAERARGLGGEEGPFRQAVEQEQRHAERSGRDHDAGQKSDHRTAEREMPEVGLELMPRQPVPQRHHRHQKQPDRDVDGMRRQDQQRACAEGSRRNAGDRIGGAGAPVDLAPPRQDARQVRQHGGDRHDRDGFLRPVFVGEHGHQHDRGAGADDARQGAGDEADREDEQEIQDLRSPRFCCSGNGQRSKLCKASADIAIGCHDNIRREFMAMTGRNFSAARSMRRRVVAGAFLAPDPGCIHAGLDQVRRECRAQQ